MIYRKNLLKNNSERAEFDWKFINHTLISYFELKFSYEIQKRTTFWVVLKNMLKCITSFFPINSHWGPCTPGTLQTHQRLYGHIILWLFLQSFVMLCHCPNNNGYMSIYPVLRDTSSDCLWSLESYSLSLILYRWICYLLFVMSDRTGSP